MIASEISFMDFASGGSAFEERDRLVLRSVPVSRCKIPLARSTTFRVCNWSVRCEFISSMRASSISAPTRTPIAEIRRISRACTYEDGDAEG